MPRRIVRSGDRLVLRFHYRAEKAILNPSFGFRLFTELGTLITATSHGLHGIHIQKVDRGEGYIDMEIDSLNLVPGRYYLSLWITGVEGTPIYDGDVRTSFQVEVADVCGSGRELSSRNGIVYFPQHWELPQTLGTGPRYVSIEATVTES